MKVIDIHTHWWKEIGWFAPGFQWDIAVIAAKSTWPYGDPNEMFKTGAIGSEDYLSLDADGSRLIQCAKDADIDVSVIVPNDWGGGYNDDAAVSIEEINKVSCDLTRKYPDRVYSCCGVDPRRPNAVKLFEKAVTEWGAKGLKLHPANGFYPNEPTCYPIYQKAIDLGVPVIIHTGYTCPPRLHSVTTEPIYIDDVAVDFPDLTIIIAHTGIQTRSSYSWWEEAMGIAQSKFNVHLDLTGWNLQVVGLTSNIPELLRMLRVQCDIVGAHRILFGTDLPGYQLPGDKEETTKFVKLLKNLVEVGKEHGIVFSQEEAELIAHGNAERLLSI